MKEKDLEKCLDNLIIDGLIKESEQDNAEFEAALRNMSDEDFLQLISVIVPDPNMTEFKLATNGAAFSECILAENQNTKLERDQNIELPPAPQIVLDKLEEDFDYDYSDTSFQTMPNQAAHRQSNWKLWIGAIASVAAILLIVLIPTIHNMDSKICQSALIASSSYMTPSRGGNDMDFASLPKDKVRSMIPKLQEQYELLEPVEEMYVLDEPEEVSGEEYYIEATDQKEAGMQLVQAYLRTNQKDKAVKLLHELSDKYVDSDFGEHCRKLLEILE